MARTTQNAANDEDLARQAAQGCAASFEQLVARFQVPLVHFLRQRTGSIADAEDLTQETLLRAYQNLHRYDPARPFRTWLYTIARRIGINFRRSENGSSRTQTAPAIASIVTDNSDPSRALCQEEQRRQIWRRAADLLSEEKMSALWLFYVNDLPVTEIARVLDRSPGAVKTMLCRARQELLPHLALDLDFPNERQPERKAPSIFAGAMLAPESEGG